MSLSVIGQFCWKILCYICRNETLACKKNILQLRISKNAEGISLKIFKVDVLVLYDYTNKTRAI